MLENRPLKDRLNVNKLFFLIWLVYSFISLIMFRSIGGITQNLFWDILLFLGWLVTLLPAVALTGIIIGAIVESITFIKSWLFDK